MTLYTVNAGGFSAVADAFAMDEADGLWFLSMIGSQTALKVIWAALLKQPGDPVWLIQGLEGDLVGEYRRCFVPYETIGTWTTQLIRLPGSGGYHAMVYPRLAEYLFDREEFLLAVRAQEDAPHLHYQFLDRRTPLPLHSGWGQWLWERGLRTGEVQPLESEGILAYRCRPPTRGHCERTSQRRWRRAIWPYPGRRTTPATAIGVRAWRFITAEVGNETGRTG